MSGASWRAALRLRLKVLQRRYGSPLELVLLAVTTGLALWLGRKLALRLSGEWPAAALSALLLAVALGLVGAGERALYRRRELTLLLAAGLGPAHLVRVRLVELALVLSLLALPALALAKGLLGATPSAALLWAAAPILGLVGSGWALSAGWAWAGLPPALRSLLRGALFLALLAAPLARDALLATLGHPAGPGGALLALARGELARSLPWLALLAFVPLALALAGRGYGARLDAAAPRPSRTAGGWRALAALTAPLGQQAGALARRDATLILRGGFWRGALILLALPLAVALVPAIARDPETNGWQLRMAALLTIGVASAGAGFLFGVDYPFKRRAQLLLERTQPLAPRQVLRSRWAPAGLYAAGLALAAAALVAQAERPALAREAFAVGLGGVLLALIVTHHAVTFGMHGEAEAHPAEATGYPFHGGTVVVLFGIALALHWAAAIAYPLLWRGFTLMALKRWERAEVLAGHGSAA